MLLTWLQAIDDGDLSELAAMCRAAPLGSKQPDRLRITFTNSMYRGFVFADADAALRGGCIEET